MAVVVLLMLTKVEAQLCLLLTSLCLEVRIHGVVFVISSHYHCVTPLPLHATAAVLYCSSCTHHCSGQGWSLLSPDSPALSHIPGENVPCVPSQQHLRIIIQPSSPAPLFLIICILRDFLQSPLTLHLILNCSAA